ncbi:MAG: hypothetical protein Q9208_007910 [Pyrenodesmia sp. 3 TL-2023]
MLSLTYKLGASAIVAFIVATTSAANDCGENYSRCSPKGATSTDTPEVGTDLSPLYTDLLTSINGVKQSKRSAREARDEAGLALESRATSSNLCCVAGTQCLLLQGLKEPFCYDNYTTNFFLPGGAYGQIVSGDYNGTNGVANLVTGQFNLTDGTTGNIYGSPESPDRPNTSTLPIPTQYTAAGSGSAIAATALGQVLTITTTIPGTTIEPSTLPPETLAPSISGTRTVAPATVRPGTTISGSTVAAKTSTYTTTAAAGTSTAQGKAGTVVPAVGGAAGFGLLLLAIIGL